MNSSRPPVSYADAARLYCIVFLVLIVLLGSFTDDEYLIKKMNPAVGQACDEIYVVGEGETLHTISEKCGDPFIVEENPHIHDPDEVFPGLVIKITPYSPRREPVAGGGRRRDLRSGYGSDQGRDHQGVRWQEVGSFKDALLGNASSGKGIVTVDLPPLVTKAKSEWMHMYVGGLKVLTFDNPAMADEFRRLQFEEWSQWFSRLYVWEGDPGVFERLAWIEITGVPACLWDDHVFNRIGERFGRLVKKSEAPLDDGNLSHEKLFILVHHGYKISEEVCVRRNNSSFKVWVHEIEDNWYPAFLDIVDPTVASPGEHVPGAGEECLDDANVEARVPRADIPAPEEGPPSRNSADLANRRVGLLKFASEAQEKAGPSEPSSFVKNRNREPGPYSAQRKWVPDLNSSVDDPFNLDKTISEVGAKRKAKRKRVTPDRFSTFSKSEGDPEKELKDWGEAGVNSSRGVEVGVEGRVGWKSPPG
ncbi:hypothetical protein L1987_35667 [Smallanthus sonchifolius]|uniref:Uncharacterized protein n=1 Tax=Smallanthus sonchifolius TaxID=185202 RepID=A0ACB9HD10_9ASTR|nr:hypothetical protein L1987_35667 [Smallanthus sonchifolius]